MKKNLIIVIFCIVIILLLVPFKIERLKDGGSVNYNGLIYKLTKRHIITDKSKTGYIDGFKFEIFGITIIDKVNYHTLDKVIDKLEGTVTLVLKSGTLTEKGASFVINNYSDNTYIYGPEYYIEIKENGIWNEMQLKEPLTWNSFLLTLNPKEKKEFIIDWANTSYNILSKGQYRLAKSLTNKSNNKDKITIYAEFEIK